MDMSDGFERGEGVLGHKQSRSGNCRRQQDSGENRERGRRPSHDVIHWASDRCLKVQVIKARVLKI